MNVIEVKGKTYTELADARKRVAAAADHARELAQTRTPPERTRVTLSAEAQHMHLNHEQQMTLARQEQKVAGVSHNAAAGIGLYTAGQRT